MAVCARSDVFTERELATARSFCEKRNIKLTVIDHDVYAIDGFADNPPNRCYICKKALFERLLTIATDYSLAAVIEGSNLDDLGDYRPGHQATLELSVRSPLLEAGLDKTAIRQLARELDLECAELPAQACLATRFGFGDKTSPDRLRLVEKAENYLHDLGLGLVRVRVSEAKTGNNHTETGSLSGRLVETVAFNCESKQPHLPGLSARIECDQAGLELLADKNLQTEVVDRLQALGFCQVDIDPAGYQQGSMNRSMA